jgi:hypothetical protein
MKTLPVTLILASALLALPGAANALFPGGGFCDQSCVAARNAQQEETRREKQRYLDLALVAAAITGVTLYLTRHWANRADRIIGCLQSVDGTGSLIDEKEKVRYSLVGNVPLKGGRFRLEGTKVTEDGRAVFRVDRISRDYGACK